MRTKLPPTENLDDLMNRYAVASNEGTDADYGQTRPKRANWHEFRVSVNGAGKEEIVIKKRGGNFVDRIICWLQARLGSLGLPTSSTKAHTQFCNDVENSLNNMEVNPDGKNKLLRDINAFTQKRKPLRVQYVRNILEQVSVLKNAQNIPIPIRHEATDSNENVLLEDASNVPTDTDNASPPPGFPTQLNLPPGFPTQLNLPANEVTDTKRDAAPGAFSRMGDKELNDRLYFAVIVNFIRPRAKEPAGEEKLAWRGAVERIAKHIISSDFMYKQEQRSVMDDIDKWHDKENSYDTDFQKKTLSYYVNHPEVIVKLAEATQAFEDELDDPRVDNIKQQIAASVDYELEKIEQRKVNLLSEEEINSLPDKLAQDEETTTQQCLQACDDEMRGHHAVSWTKDFNQDEYDNHCKSIKEEMLEKKETYVRKAQWHLQDRARLHNQNCQGKGDAPETLLRRKRIYLNGNWNLDEEIEQSWLEVRKEIRSDFRREIRKRNEDYLI